MNTDNTLGVNGNQAEKYQESFCHVNVEEIIISELLVWCVIYLQWALTKLSVILFSSSCSSLHVFLLQMMNMVRVRIYMLYNLTFLRQLYLPIKEIMVVEWIMYAKLGSLMSQMFKTL